MTHSAPFLVRLSCVIALVLAACQAGWSQSMQSERYKGEGILVYRERDSQSDEFAPAIKFKSYEKFSSVFHFDVGTGNPMILPTYLVAAIISSDELQADQLINGADQAKLEAHVHKLKDWVKRYPRAATLGKPLIAGFDEDLKKMKSGWVRDMKKWLTREAYEAEQAEYRRKEMLEQEGRERIRAAVQRSEYDQQEREKAATGLRVQHTANLTNCKPVTFGGRHLMGSWEDFLGIAVNDIYNAKARSRMTLPQSITQGALDLPGIKSASAGAGTVPLAGCGFREGSSSGAPAVLYMHDDKGCLMFRLALALKTEGDTTVNTGDLQAATRMLSSALPEIADWLPLAIVSARTKLQFQRSAQGKAEKAWVPKFGGWTKIGGHFCSLKVNAPVVQADGSFYSMVMVSVF